MRIKHHLSQSLQLQPTPSPWPRMILSGLAVGLPLLVGWQRDELQIAIFGSLFGFIMILNDHFGPLSRRVLHLITAWLFIITGVGIGMLLAPNSNLLMLAIFFMSYMVGKSKGLGLELERMLLFTTLQLMAASQQPEIRAHFMQAFFYSSFSLLSYLICLCLVYLIMRHQPNFQKSKRQELKEAFTRKETNRYAFTMAFMSCIGLWFAQYLHVERGYWVVGTILIVMMPDRYQSLYKSFQRLLGTLIGVVIASILIKLGKDPLVLILLCSFAAFMTPYGQIKNYWLANVFIAGLILFFLEISNYQPHHGDFDLAILRLTDIGLGCLLGIIGTLIAFPDLMRKERS
jgi:uncharacterized membrane protein YccC